MIFGGGRGSCTEFAQTYSISATMAAIMIMTSASAAGSLSAGSCNPFTKVDSSAARCARCLRAWRLCYQMSSMLGRKTKTRLFPAVGHDALNEEASGEAPLSRKINTNCNHLTPLLHPQASGSQPVASRAPQCAWAVHRALALRRCGLPHMAHTSGPVSADPRLGSLRRAS